MAETTLIDTLPEGWLTAAEARTLSELAAGKTVLEIGAWVGRSTVAMAYTAKLVVSVDHHHGPPHDGGGSTLGRFLTNLENREIHNVIPVLGFSQQALPLLGRHFDLAFIDAGHEWADVLNDGHAAWRVVVAGGLLVFHDYEQHAGVKPAVDELCKTWNTQMHREAETLAIVRRTVA